MAYTRKKPREETSTQTRRISQKVLPVINYIWVGPPTENEQDTFGPLKMASVNSSNEILFWCLREHEEHYRRVFAGHAIKVCSIQSLLENNFEDPFLRDAARKIIEIAQETLGWGKDPAEFARGSKRDFVSFKNLLSLLLLALGGYTLDTNVYPADGVPTLQLPDDKSFKIPQLPQQLEWWMMYASKNNTQARKALALYLDRWNQLQTVFDKHGGYTEEFHNHPLMCSVLRETCLNKHWKAVSVEEGIYHVVELNLIKTYQNTHTFENFRENQDKKFVEKNKFMLFTRAEGLKLPDRPKSVIFEYAFTGDTTDLFMQSGATHVFSLARTIPSTGIFNAILENNVSQLKKYIDRGEALRQVIKNKDWENVTPIHLAILCNRPDCLKLLCANATDLFVSATYQGRAFEPLQLAQNKQCDDLADIVFEHIQRIADTRRQKAV